MVDTPSSCVEEGLDRSNCQPPSLAVCPPSRSRSEALARGLDYFAFTDKRVAMVDKQGIAGSKTESHSILHKSRTHFSIETAGTSSCRLCEATMYLVSKRCPRALCSDRQPMSTIV